MYVSHLPPVLPCVPYAQIMGSLGKKNRKMMLIVNNHSNLLEYQEMISHNIAFAIMNNVPNQM